MPSGRFLQVHCFEFLAKVPALNPRSGFRSLMFEKRSTIACCGIMRVFLPDPHCISLISKKVTSHNFRHSRIPFLFE